MAHLRLRAADEAFFRLAIQKRGASRRGQTDEAIGNSLGRANIEQVRRALRLKLQRDLSVEVRGKLIEFLSTHTRVLVVSSDDFDYAYQIFLTINGRGMPLSEEDIIVAEVIGPLNAAQRRRFEPILDQIGRYRDGVWDPMGPVGGP